MDLQLAIGVIFDMDGVLVDSADAHFRSWQLLAEECGVTVTQAQFAETFGRQNRDIIPRLFGSMSPQRLTALADRKEQLYRDLIRKRPPIVDGAAELARDLRDRGARLAVGSSAPRENIDLILAALDWCDAEFAVVSGEDVSRGKPDPEVFVRAAEQLKLPPGRCVVIEDAPVGIQAAHAAGAKAVAILLYHAAEAFENPDLVVPRLADLSAKELIDLLPSHDG